MAALKYSTNQGAQNQPNINLRGKLSLHDEEQVYRSKLQQILKWDF